MLLIYGRLFFPDYTVLIFLIFPLIVIGASIVVLAIFRLLLMRIVRLSNTNATLCAAAVGLAQYFLGLQLGLDASTELFSVVFAWCAVILVVASAVGWWLNARSEHERR